MTDGYKWRDDLNCLVINSPLARYLTRANTTPVPHELTCSVSNARVIRLDNLTHVKPLGWWQPAINELDHLEHLPKQLGVPSDQLSVWTIQQSREGVIDGRYFEILVPESTLSYTQWIEFEQANPYVWICNQITFKQGDLNIFEYCRDAGIEVPQHEFS
ncbi:hypothetical protein IC617_03215 [Neiella sp. HB171785]|uniref:Uncharacterized protein n=1 Tax=Neiella litorisoli TaxID=2771431 RepID=A0A8J6UIG8_9GAMM|nr:hypothetical protein [Neiella litorisoli]MBD1388428.1 hypothetical protein [Neiella litorisoli]